MRGESWPIATTGIAASEHRRPSVGAWYEESESQPTVVHTLAGRDHLSARLPDTRAITVTPPTALSG